MADAQVQADVEQARGTQFSDDASHPPRAAWQFRSSDPKPDINADKVIVLSFRNLQLKRIGALQDKLIAQSLAREPLPPDHSDQVDQALRAYAQALRDYETLSVNAVPTIPIGARLVGSMEVAGEERQITFGDKLARIAFRIFPWLEPYSGFVGVFKTAPELEILKKTFHTVSPQGTMNLGPSLVVDFMKSSCGDLGFRELDQQGRVRRAEKQAFTQRILMGVFGGIALICPVLVMVLYPSRNTNLITVSVATILFASLLAIGASDSTGKDVLAATAAYTAVLVVFFGTSGS